MYRLEDLQSLVEEQLKSLNFEKEPRELYQPIAYTLESGGKRIRPALVLAAANLFSDDVKSALMPALGFEVFHNFTLIHDDIMDNSDKRRNLETVHKKWDVNRAILSGDAMMISAYELIATAPAGILHSVLDLFNKTAFQVCEGQQYDMNFETRKDVRISEYLNMIRLKTAVLMAGCLKAGALIAGADTKSADCLYKYGTELGTAFQLQDDLLDIYADEETFGKPIGGDIAEGKKTALYLEALRQAQPKDRNFLFAAFSDNTVSRAQKIKKVTALYEKYGIAELISERIKEHYKKALASLEKVNTPRERKEVLYGFGEKIMARQK